MELTRSEPIKKTLRWPDRLHVLGMVACLGGIILGLIFWIVIEQPLEKSLDLEAARIREQGEDLLSDRHYFPASLTWFERQLITAGPWMIGVILTLVGTFGFRGSEGTRKGLRSATWKTVLLTMLAGMAMGLL